MFSPVLFVKIINDDLHSPNVQARPTQPVANSTEQQQQNIIKSNIPIGPLQCDSKENEKSVWSEHRLYL